MPAWSGNGVFVSVTSEPGNAPSRRLDGPRQTRDEIESDFDYKRIFERSAIAIFRSTTDGRYIRANPAAARLHGYDCEADLLRAVSNVAEEIYVNPEDRETMRRRLVEQGSVEGFECEIYRHKSRERIWVRQNVYPINDRQGRLRYLEGYVEDLTSHFRIEEALRKSETLLRQAMRTARTGAWVWDDSNDECIYCSEELAALFGETVEEYLANRSTAPGLTALIHPDDKEHYERVTAEATASGKRYSVEFREMVSDGTYRHFREIGEPVEDYMDGRQISAGTVHDITEIKDAERALRLSDADLNRAQRQARIGSWRWDIVNKKLISCSEEFARIHGLSTDEATAAMNTQVDRVVHPDDRERLRAEFKRFYEERLDFEIEYRIVRPDGEIRHVLEISEMLLNENGVPVEQVGTLQDITERKLMEDQIRLSRDELEETVRTRTAQLLESESRYRTIFLTAAVGIGRTRVEDGSIILSNEKLATMFGYESAETFMADYVFSEHYVNPDDRDRVFASYENSPGEPIECSFTKRDGTAITVQAHAIVNYEQGYLDFVVIDVTDHRAAEERLRQAQKMEAVGQLTGGIAHDFNNLLAVIMGSTELLLRRSRDDNDLLETIVQSASRGAELTQRLLAFSRRQPLRPRAIDLGALTSDMSDLLGRTLGETIEIDIEVQAGLWEAMADPGQVESALLNLSLNARDAMAGSGKLSIKCLNATIDESNGRDLDLAAGAYVVLTVSDEGCGMAADTKNRAVEPFFTTKEAGQGSGLGLSMVYGFAKQSGGNLAIESQESLGTTVRLYLPRGETAGGEDATTRKEDVPRGQGQTVLVLEDDSDVRALTVLMLEDLDYEVIDVGSVNEARAVLARGDKIDLVLSDVVLPGGVSGPAFLEEVKAAERDFEVVFMSGHPSDAGKGTAFLNLNKFLLKKPFTLLDLAKAVQVALDGGKSRA